MKYIAVAAFFLVVSHVTHAQCDSLSQAMLYSDSLTITAPMNPDGSLDMANALPNAAAAMTAFYLFEYSTDSAHVKMEFSEFMSNGRKLFLDNWCKDRVVNWDYTNNVAAMNWTESDMRANSKTREFDVIAGDTLQFFRTIWWEDRLQNGVSYDRYVNPNPLSYCVELYDATTGARIAKMDTMLLSPTTPTRQPCIYSWYPMLSRVRMVVPGSVTTSTPARIRIGIHTYPLNTQPVVRLDYFDFARSQFILSNATWLAYNTNVEANLGCPVSSCDVMAAGLSGPSRISLVVASPTSLDYIGIYSPNGQQVWGTAFPVANPVQINLSPGLYIVVGIDGGQAVCTRKVVVP